jgi:predicted amidohydrolase
MLHEQRTGGSLTTTSSFFSSLFNIPVGSSFITNNTGDVLQRAEKDTEEIIFAQFDLADYAAQRASWGLFRDRRPDLYAPVLTKDGDTLAPGVLSGCSGSVFGLKR